MSTTNSLHYQLCLEGAMWLHRKKRRYGKCQGLPCHDPQFCRNCECYDYVAVEMVTYAAEKADVWGYCRGDATSAVIEVKTSHADFLADRKKFSRSKESEERGLQAGNRRWYLCPEGVIKPEELPEGWGLLYWDGKAVRHVVPPTVLFRDTGRSDIMILASILRREGFPKKIFNYRNVR